jgi:hypothetical protein
MLMWLLPTRAVIPAAALALLAGVPQKLYGHYDKTREATSWFAEMFLAGRHSEMKEFFLAMFILMYMWSLATRFRSIPARAQDTRSESEVAIPHFAVARQPISSSSTVHI